MTDRSATPVSFELEGLARRLLELLGRLTGLDSTYLTRIDWNAGLQDILYARNVGPIEIPEGLSVDWADTLCRRALEGGSACTDDVPAVYPDSQAAKELGINTYVTAPVLLPDGSVYGTICGASARSIQIDEDVRLLLATLAEMVSLPIANDAARAALERMTTVDDLTDVANRRGFDQALARVCSFAARRGEPVTLLAVDVDSFKQVNDTYGHGTGDEVLRAIARHLVALTREEDTVARVGGDEFMVILASTTPSEGLVVAERVRVTVAASAIETQGGPVEVSVSLGVAGGVGEGPDSLVGAADAALYASKDAGRNVVSASS